jgi:hypothetical protein
MFNNKIAVNLKIIFIRLNEETHPLRYSNIIEIKKKLRDSGRKILDIIYSKRASVALM